MDVCTVNAIAIAVRCLVVSVLVVWSAISLFGHCTGRRRQSTMVIIRGPEDLICKASLN